MQLSGWNVLLVALMPVCAATAVALTKYLSRYTLYETITHPVFPVIVLLGSYEFFAGWYLYKPGVLHAKGAPMSVLEPVTVISTILIAILIGVGVWKETLTSTQGTAMSLIVPLLYVAFTGKFPILR